MSSGSCITSTYKRLHPPPKQTARSNNKTLFDATFLSIPFGEEYLSILCLFPHIVFSLFVSTDRTDNGKLQKANSWLNGLQAQGPEFDSLNPCKNARRRGTCL